MTNFQQDDSTEDRSFVWVMIFLVFTFLVAMFIDEDERRRKLENKNGISRR